ncbi:MAG TPA: alkaline phosphatase family protein [Saprospiraceae bacterium]|nr:alkaline phosphatase family protein [Saprospiraceae bacterium]HMQ85727.1 alkaline phosphatase family protein [Saprospiraceae bacterium]
MKPSFIAIFMLLILFSACKNEAPGSTEKANTDQPKKAVFIIVDGIPADVIEKLSTPVLDEIAGVKGYTHSYVGGEKGTYSETPTISAPGYMDLLTATWAHKHNVVDNYDQKPNYNYWTIFRIAETVQPELKTAIFSTWQDNRTILVGEGLSAAGGIQLDYAFDGFELDTLRFPHDERSDYVLAIDELVAEEAGKYIAEQGPDLSWVYLQYTDDIGHEAGDSEAFYEAVRKADAQVGKVWEAVKKRIAMGEDWMIVITTDHGRDALTGKEHGEQSERERATWMVTNTADLNSRFTQGTPSIIDITPSILRHLNLQAPVAVQQEMDGIPFVGDVSLDSFRVKLENNTLMADWRPIATAGEARILASFGNKYRDGGKDDYQELGRVAVETGTFQWPLNAEQLAALEQSRVLKVLIEAPANKANYWWQL